MSFVIHPAEWWPVANLPEEFKGTSPIVVGNNRNMTLGISQYEDLPDRRGFRHRNGFSATHFLAFIPTLPPFDANDSEAINSGSSLAREQGLEWSSMSPEDQFTFIQCAIIIIKKGNSNG